MPPLKDTMCQNCILPRYLRMDHVEPHCAPSHKGGEESSGGSGRFWPVRKYPWGTCEALSSVHSDVGALKRLLFEEGYEELKGATEERYYHYRSQQLLNLDDPTL